MEGKVARTIEFFINSTTSAGTPRTKESFREWLEYGNSEYFTNEELELTLEWMDGLSGEEFTAAATKVREDGATTVEP